MAPRKVASTATTEKKQRGNVANLKPFLPGQSGNPAGRPKGSRNAIAEAFLDAMLADFKEHGEAAIQTVRAERPHEYLKVVASILPKQVDVRTTAVEEMSDDDLALAVAALQSIVAAQQAGSGSDAETKH